MRLQLTLLLTTLLITQQAWPRDSIVRVVTVCQDGLKIGIQICFDVNWREGWTRLKQKGARIIFWPSAYAAAHQMPALAFLNQCYVVTSTMKSASRPTRLGHWTRTRLG